MSDHETIPYDPVCVTCNELVTLANSIDKAATDAIANGGAVYEMAMIRTAANRIGLLADNLIGYDCCGKDHWLDLPKMEGADNETE